MFICSLSLTDEQFRVFLSRCPEYDTLESNKHIVSGALHSCYWDGSWWQGCDSGGCGSNSWDSASGQVCPGCSIDTQSGPFLVSHFQSPDQSNIWMSQNGNEASFDICYGNGDYLNTMSEYWEDGMVLAFSLWGKIKMCWSFLSQFRQSR